jgi:hypothetical protein
MDFVNIKVLFMQVVNHSYSLKTLCGAMYQTISYYNSFIPKQDFLKQVDKLWTMRQTFIFSRLFFFMVIGTKPKASPILSIHFTTELHPHL